jgi:beta-glucosidase
MDESNDPLYPFGFGLSYTRYAYERLAVQTPVVSLGGTLVVEADVRNAGARGGEEIVQLYVRDLVGSVTRPVKELKAFRRVPLQAGERRTVRFELPVSQLGFHGLDNCCVVEPGQFRVWVGPSSAEGLEGEFELR